MLPMAPVQNLFSSAVKHIKSIGWVITICAVFFMLAAVWYFPSVTVTENAVDLLPENVELQLQNVKFTSTQDGMPVWILTADRAEREGAGGITRARNVMVVLFGVEETKTVLTAKQGEITPDRSRIRVRGNVKIVRDDGAILLTDYLEYNKNTGTVTTDSVVHFTAEGMRVAGRGMYLDVARRNVRLMEDVEAVIEEQEKF